MVCVLFNKNIPYRMPVYKIKNSKTAEEISIELDSKKTINDLAKECSLKLECDVDNIKIIQMGKICQNNETLEDKGNNFIAFVSENKTQKTVNTSKDIDEGKNDGEGESKGEDKDVFMENKEIAQKMTTLLTTIIANPDIRETVVRFLSDKYPDIKKLLNEEPEKFKELIRDQRILQGVILNIMSIMEEKISSISESIASTASTTVLPSFSDDENKIINDIKEIVGKSFEEIAEAFIVCERNKELTINYLLG